MSNPGVMLLAEKEICGRSFRIEDNIGEAIHIHFGDMRIDMTIAEFFDFSEQLTGLVNRMIDVDGVDIRDFDPVYLFLGLKDFVSLKRIETDNVMLSRLVTDTKDADETERFISISDSRVTKALGGEYSGLFEREQINLYGEGNKARFEKILESVKENGYPIDNKHIILYNDGFYIRDGLHRASCLYYLLGDIKVPVRRLHFYDKAHSDEYREVGFEEKRLGTKEREMRRFEQVDSKEVIRPFYKELLNITLKGKKVAIKGAGRHTEEVLKMLDESVDLRCIIAREVKIKVPPGVEVIDDGRIKDYDIDIILLSSIMDREEMKNDILKATANLKRNYYVLDIYKVMENLGIHVTRGIT